MRQISLIVLLLTLDACSATAQARQSESGTVTGRVFLADTNSPARLAHVLLVPAFDTVPLEAAKAREQNKQVPEPSTVYAAKIPLCFEVLSMLIAHARAAALLLLPRD